MYSENNIAQALNGRTDYPDTAAPMAESNRFASPGVTVGYPSKPMEDVPSFHVQADPAQRYVQIHVEGAPHTPALAYTDPDVGIMVVIGCQTLPLNRWRRTGERIIRAQYRHYPEALIDALCTALADVLRVAEKMLAA